MEKELNIGAILKDKPRGIQLFDLLHNVKVKLDKIEYVENNNQETIIWCEILNSNKMTIFNYSHIGTEVGWLNGLQILKPSMEMRDWSKFAWKKGDILQISHIGFCTFEEWTSDNYTTFKGRYGVDLGKNNDNDYDVNEDLITSMWNKVDNKDFIKEYLSTVEERFGGKLNLSTLEIGKPQLKDGDVVVIAPDKTHKEIIAILKGDVIGRGIKTYCHKYGDEFIAYGLSIKPSNNNVSLATDSEKQQLFDALARVNKAWDAEKKAVVDLPKKCGFKPMDWCLMRFRGTNKDVWKLCQFGFIDDEDKNDLGYCAIGGNWFDECIPYNDQTAHLLGTTDDWKGGEA